MNRTDVLNLKLHFNLIKKAYQFNGHGDVVGLTDSSGTELNSYSYDIWGNPIDEEEDVPNVFRYSGEYWDSDTGLQYLRSRWYDPNAARFVSRDTYKAVVGLFQKQADEIYKVHISEEIIEATAEHPFWLDGKGWTLVKDLNVGDLLVSSDGTTLAIDKIEKEPREATVYNFEVADFHSYFVSNLGIWVHNCKVDFKNFSAKEIERKFDLKKGQFHKVKQDIIKDLTNKNSPFKDKMKKVGNNPDIHLSSDGTIRIMSRDGKTSFDTDWSINGFLP